MLVTARRTTSVFTRERALIVALALIVVVGGWFRVSRLNYGGFSEDEINKVKAVRAYARGELSENAEHPMLMKLAMRLSTSAADAWNETATRKGWREVSPEAALRLPNAFAGALAIVLLFLLARAFFGTPTGMWASLLLALDVNATGINRIGKEDTFLVLFLLLGAWCYERARQLHLERRAPTRWYAASGAAFGLMLASKYMPYYLGLWALFGLAAAAERNRRGERDAVPQRAPHLFYAAMVTAFVAANPAILLPSTWTYLLGYVTGETITHHGTFFGGRLYNNMIEATPWGLPWDYYLDYLITKTPLPVLAAIAPGIVQLVRRRRERGAVFARVFLLFFLLPASLVASKFARYLLPTLVVLDLVAALGVVWCLELIQRHARAALRPMLTAATVAVVAGGPLLALASSSPHPSLFRNAIGRHSHGGRLLIPEDELYDIGLREAVTWAAQHAAFGAAIASDAPGVVREYLDRARRTDVEARSLSMRGVAPLPRETWVIAQDSHLCFESAGTVEQLRRRERPAYTYRVRGISAVEVFRVP